MEQQTFADGIGRITIIDGIVRLDLVAHSATETDAAGKPKPVFAHRIVMGVDQFLRASQKITDTTHAIAQQRRPVTQPIEPPVAPQAAPQPPQNRPQGVPPEYRREVVRPETHAAAASRPFP
jgi:hypothetical protein